MRLPPIRVGLGAVTALPPGAVLPASFTQAETDLQNQFTAVVTAGDTYLNAGETAQALQTYRAAGAAGASSVGPEIDLLGYPQASQPLTQQAWKINGYLQASSTTPQQAQAYAKQMQLYYTEALSAAEYALTEPPVTQLPPLGASQVAWLAIAGAVFAGAYIYVRGGP